MSELVTELVPRRIRQICLQLAKGPSGSIVVAVIFKHRHQKPQHSPKWVDWPHTLSRPGTLAGLPNSLWDASSRLNNPLYQQTW